MGDRSEVVLGIEEVLRAYQATATARSAAILTVPQAGHVDSPVVGHDNALGPEQERW